MTEVARFSLICPSDWVDIFIAEFGELGFDMMEETEKGIEAFIQASRKEEADTTSLLAKYKDIEGLTGSWDLIETVNWNIEWEKSYDPVTIDDKCIIRAPFHKFSNKFDFDIVIDPRMSFGTGHHPTTYLMASAILGLGIDGCTVLDAGTGTGVLAILAEKMGAESIDAYDIDEWCVNNSLENLELNRSTKVTIQKGTIREVTLKSGYDYIFANINKNSLLAEMSKYAEQLNNGGKLFLSGFYSHDCSDLITAGSDLDLKVIFQTVSEEWAVLGLQNNI